MKNVDLRAMSTDELCALYAAISELLVAKSGQERRETAKSGDANPVHTLDSDA